MITFAEALSLVENKVRDIPYPEQPAHLYQPIAYLLALKGKKIRPVLTLLAYSLYKEDPKESINAALAWEIFHNFTLMHDDIMDHADVRRGQPTVHKKWDENTAILSGDTMLILAYKYMSSYSGDIMSCLLNLFSTTAIEICEGQEYDMQFENRLDVSEEEYLNMIRLKTAVMIGACLKTGAILGEASPTDQQWLYEFGIHLGMAFQIQDDLLDVYGDPLLFGKNTGGDILCNKKTYLLVSALEVATDSDREELTGWLKVANHPEEKVRSVIAIYDRLKIREKAIDARSRLYRQAIESLRKVNVPDSKKEILSILAEQLMDRKT